MKIGNEPTGCFEPYARTCEKAKDAVLYIPEPMPITRTAKKNLRQSIRKKAVNDVRKKAMRDAVKEVKKEMTPGNLSTAYKQLDKAAKKNSIHKNRASRLKSRLAKRVAKAVAGKAA